VEGYEKLPKETAYSMGKIRIYSDGSSKFLNGENEF